MDDILAAVEAPCADFLLDHYDYDSTVVGFTVQQVNYPGDALDPDFGMSELHFDPAVAGGSTFDLPMLLYQKRDTVAANAVQGSVDLCDTNDHIEAQQAERLPEAESQRQLVAVNAAVKMRSSPGHQKRRRDTADDGLDAGVARGAPRRATVTAEGARPAEQLEPAPRDDGSRREEHAPADREPVAAAATSLVSCGVKRDAATQVSEAQLLQAFDTVMRDASAQVSEDEEPSHPEEIILATPLGYSSPSSEVTALGGEWLELLPDDRAGGVSEDVLQLLSSDCAAYFTGDATFPFQSQAYAAAPTDEDFTDFLYDFYELLY